MRPFTFFDVGIHAVDLVLASARCTASRSSSRCDFFSTKFLTRAKSKSQTMNSWRYQIEYGPSALADLDDLPARERAQIIRKIERLEHGLHGNIKHLHNAEAAYRLRMGDYRILFDVEDDVIVIRKIGNRKDVYD
jgi:mRNA interferase RelE/StbE